MANKSDKDFTIQNEFLAKLELVFKTMDDIDDIIDKTANEQSRIDSLRSDYLHMFENYDLSEESMRDLSQKMHDCCVIRRNWNNVYAIGKSYRENIGKIIFKGQREFAYNSIKHVINTLNCDYKNRILSDEDVEDILNKTAVKKIKTIKKEIVRKKHLSKDKKQEICDRVSKGESPKLLATEYNVCINTIKNIYARSCS